MALFAVVGMPSEYSTERFWETGRTCEQTGLLLVTGQRSLGQVLRTSLPFGQSTSVFRDKTLGIRVAFVLKSWKMLNQCVYMNACVYVADTCSDKVIG